MEMSSHTTATTALQIVKMTDGDIPSALAVFDRAYAKMDVPPDEREWFEGDLRRAFQEAIPNNITFFKIEQP